LLADEAAVSRSSMYVNASGSTSPDVNLLQLIDKLGLAKYANVFIEQEVAVIFKSLVFIPNKLLGTFGILG